MPSWLKTILKTLAFFASFIIVALIAVTLYINFHKQYFLNAIVKELNKNLHGGTLTIKNINPNFLSGFPGVSVSLKDVVIRDSLWKIHHHTLLQAKEFNISISALALLKGEIAINKIGFSQANIYLFTDSTGYSNTFIFKKNGKPKTAEEKENNAYTKVKRFDLNQVSFVLDNQKGHKLFHFDVANFNSKMDYQGNSWDAKVNLSVLAKDMAFNSLRGSFIKNKIVQGTLEGSYNSDNGIIAVKPNTLNIGDDPFTISANFYTIKNAGNFNINIAAESVLWKNITALLATNIAHSLNRYQIKNPIAVNGKIAGSFSSAGDPAINVNCKVENNTITTPGGTIDSCNFRGAFTNEYVKGKVRSDENSAVKFYKIVGNYEHVPITIDTGTIVNLAKPIATGKLTSNFAVSKLNYLLGGTLNFTKGTVNLDIKFNTNIVDFKFVKPTITGLINIKNADVNYIPRNLNFKNTSIFLDFNGNDLFLKNIHLQSGKSIVYMEGSVHNILNLYYTAPEKILLNWQIHSPQLYLGEFLGFLGKKKSTTIKKKNSSNFANQLSTVLEKGRADMHLNIQKLYYNKFMATDANANILLSESGIEIKNVSVKNAGGFVKLNGSVVQNTSSNHFTFNADVSNVNISNFFYSFDNFGLDGFTYKNLKGFLFLKSKFTGNITDQGKIIPKSVIGNIALNLKNGALIDFAPIVNVGRFAFPLRNLNNIVFNNLDGKFDLKGDKITINPMMINSSVLNMNIAGVYSLSTGTNIALDVPLRNPKKDELIADSQEKLDKRMKGIVLHILAADGENGKIKFRWNKNHN